MTDLPTTRIDLKGVLSATAPTVASTSITKSAYGFSPLFPCHSGVGAMGVCGAFSGR